MSSESKILTGSNSKSKDCFYVVIYNARAGRMREKMLNKIRAFFADNDLPHTITDLAYIDWSDVRTKVREYDDVRFVVGGGDGTLRLVLEDLWKERLLNAISVAFIPLGSANMTAVSLGLPFGLQRSLQKAVTGTPHAVDLGIINNTYAFFIAASFGSVSKFVTSTHRGIKKRIGGLAYLFNIHTLILGNYRKERFTICCEEEDGCREVQAHSLIVCNHFNLAQLKPLRGIAADDQRLHLITLHYATFKGLLKAAYDFYFGKTDSTVLQHKRLTSARYVLKGFSGSVHLDGDVYTHLGDELEFRVLPRAVKLIV